MVLVLQVRSANGDGGAGDVCAGGLVVLVVPVSAAG